MMNITSPAGSTEAVVLKEKKNEATYLATNWAIHMVRGGKKVMIRRSMIKIAKNGTIRLLMAASVSPEIEHETIRQIPIGGVSIPIAMKL
jgi:hypothetical protein